MVSMGDVPSPSRDTIRPSQVTGRRLAELPPHTARLAAWTMTLFGVSESTNSPFPGDLGPGSLKFYIGVLLLF